MGNAIKAAPDIKIAFEEQRKVNGAKILCLRLEGTVEQILPVTWLGYYYTGKAGTFQVATFAPQNLFQEFEQDFFDFLNGLEITE